jgi:peptidoglycan/xylan/chitin deacetylase (PgdA/CDA1 family)
MKPMDSRRGALIISLDFELYWGVLETKTVEQYRQNLLGARAAIPKLLELFERYQVHATWATVGLLFFGRKPDLLEALPERQPAYRKGNLSSYREIPHIGETESEDPYHYGESLLRLIAACPNQEIGTHTFSHYYCLEDGQDATAFREDLRAAKRAARAFQVELKSIVFPRNQVNSAYLPICADEGLICYRGVEPGVQYEAVSNAQARSPWRRALRLADSYLPIPRASNRPESNAALVNVAGSRFLRPYSPRLAAFEPLRLRRITAEMTKSPVVAST